MKRKIYLGDGAYAEITEQGDLRLTAEDGITITDAIHLDLHAVDELNKFLAEARTQS
jgi:hypothetical protein